MTTRQARKRFLRGLLKASTCFVLGAGCIAVAIWLGEESDSVYFMALTICSGLGFLIMAAAYVMSGIFEGFMHVAFNRRPDKACLNCQYPAVGWKADRCPECGAVYDPNVSPARIDDTNVRNIAVGIAAVLLFVGIVCLIFVPMLLARF